MMPKGGVKVSYLGEDGQQKTDRIKVIDWNDPAIIISW